MFSKLLAGSIVALSLSRVFAAVYWKGVNVAGFDFGCGTDETCRIASIVPPLHQYGGQDGAAQMAHFSKQDGFNIFRLPVAWQFLVNNKFGANLNPANFAKYDDLVRACLATGAYCIIDIHNYARWNGGIIGQGGAANDGFTSLWSQLAKEYIKETKVVMGLMNEPHTLDIEGWARTVQGAVTGIRKAGSTHHYILLPGNGYTNAGEFPTGSALALSRVTNLDGSTTNLIFDVHQYFDSDNSGTHSGCVSDKIQAAFAPLADYLRKHHRLALLSETGGGSNDQSCLTNICRTLSYLDGNSDVYLGYIEWSAGSFARNYILNLSPAGSTDVPLITKCFISKSGKSRNPPQLPPAPLNRPPTPLDGPPAPANPARKFKAQIKVTPITLVTAVKPSKAVKPTKAVKLSKTVKPSPAVKQPRASPSPTLEENGDDVGAVKPFKAVKPSPNSSSSTLEENEDDVGAVKSSTAVKPSPTSSSPTLEESRDDLRAVKPSPAPSSPTLEDNGDNVGCEAKL